MKIADKLPITIISLSFSLGKRWNAILSTLRKCIPAARTGDNLKGI
jgi:hypothetical protein